MIEVFNGVSIPYSQNSETSKWFSTEQHDWDVNDKYVIEFVNEADRKIRKKVKGHGTIKYPFINKSLAQTLESHRVRDDSSFYEMVKSIQLNSPLHLSATRAQTKLVLIFLHYKNSLIDTDGNETSNKEYCLVVLLKDKTALQFSDNGTPLSTNIIDFDDVMQAATFNLDKFDNDIALKQNTDISFISGVTEYFKDFFDAKDVIQNKESVDNVLKAIRDFVDELELSRVQSEKVESVIRARIQENNRKKFSTKLSEVSSAIHNTVKDMDVYDEENDNHIELNINANSFEEYVQEHDYKINEEFNVGNSDLETLEFITLDTDVGNLKVKKSLIYNDDESSVRYNPESKELTIVTELTDPEIISQITQLVNG